MCDPHGPERAAHAAAPRSLIDPYIDGASARLSGAGRIRKKNFVTAVTCLAVPRLFGELDAEAAGCRAHGTLQTASATGPTELPPPRGPYHAEHHAQGFHPDRAP